MTTSSFSSSSVVSPNGEPVREWEGWGAQPHSLTFGFCTLLFVLFAAFREKEYEEGMSTGDATVCGLKRGFKYAAIFFLTYCGTQLRDGHFRRPHPAIWRVVTGCLALKLSLTVAVIIQVLIRILCLGVFILYEMFLVVLLFQPGKDGAPRFMKHLDPDLGIPLPDKSYGEDCRLYTPEDPVSAFRNLRHTIFDQFVVMHFVGWCIGAVMIRDTKACWCLSILFEFYELSFEHWLPNFKECWWDHLFLDILICNAGGIALGMRLCQYFEMRNYDWVGINSIPNLTGKASRLMQQFTPMDWVPYDWAMFRSAHRFWRVMFMLFSLSVMMLNSFFLKTVLWVPASHSLNILRLLIWYSAGSYAVGEYYLFCVAPMDSPRAKKVGPRVWLALAVVVTEVVVVVKFGYGHFDAPFPTVVIFAWATTLVILIFGSTLYFHLKPMEVSSQDTTPCCTSGEGSSRIKKTM